LFAALQGAEERTYVEKRRACMQRTNSQEEIATQTGG
jgi:hypothetical protein